MSQNKNYCSLDFGSPAWSWMVQILSMAWDQNKTLNFGTLSQSFAASLVLFTLNVRKPDIQMEKSENWTSGGSVFRTKLDLILQPCLNRIFCQDFRLVEIWLQRCPKTGQVRFSNIYCIRKIEYTKFVRLTLCWILGFVRISGIVFLRYTTVVKILWFEPKVQLERKSLFVVNSNLKKACLLNYLTSVHIPEFLQLLTRTNIQNNAEFCTWNVFCRILHLHLLAEIHSHQSLVPNYSN